MWTCVFDPALTVGTERQLVSWKIIAGQTGVWSRRRSVGLIGPAWSFRVFRYFLELTLSEGFLLRSTWCSFPQFSTCSLLYFLFQAEKGTFRGPLGGLAEVCPCGNWVEEVFGSADVPVWLCGVSSHFSSHSSLSLSCCVFPPSGAWTRIWERTLSGKWRLLLWSRMLHAGGFNKNKKEEICEMM